MFYIFHGDDVHSRRQTIARLLDQLGDPEMLDLNTTRLPGKGLTLGDLRQACDALPFLAPVRLVLVDNALSQSPSKELVGGLLDYLPGLPETTRLIFLEDRALPARSPLLALAESAENGYAKAFKQPEGSDLERWIRRRVANGNGRIAPRAVHLLATNVGSRLTVLDNEIEKLLLYVGPDRPIEADDVNRLSPYAAEASIFALVDALGSRNGREAARLLQAKLAEGADPFYLLAMFIRQFRLLIQVKSLAEEGTQAGAIAKALKLHNFVAGKLLRQSQQFSADQLAHIYAHLLDIDVRVKTGRADLTTSLNLLVAGVTS